MRGTARRGLLGHDSYAGSGADPIHLQACRSVCGLALLACMVSAATAAPAQVQTVRVLRVVDGDTVVVSTAESLNFKVRLQGIDAPECGMPFGPQAQRFLEQLVLGRTVQMATTSRDRYGRTVATLAVGGQDVGLTLLRAGLAWHGHRHSRPRISSDANRYAEAQDGALAHLAGLWADPERMSPRLWRIAAHQMSARGRCLGGSTPKGTP
jgi:endonuclease YncB( thermonuclease family)